MYIHGRAALAAAIAVLLLPLSAFAQHAHHARATHEAASEGEPPKQKAETEPATDATHHAGQAGHQPMPVGQSEAEGHDAMDHGAMGRDAKGDYSGTHGGQDRGVQHDAASHGARPHVSGVTGHDVMERRASPLEPRTPIPAVTDADRAAAIPPPRDHPVHDNGIFSHVLINRLEAWNADPGTGLGWEGQAWIGTDLDRLWLRSEGARVAGRTQSADMEVLYGRSVAPWWDVVAGVRHDFQPGGSQDFAAIGVVGLAPYKFEVEATVYLGESGQSAARLEVEYETLLTNRLILQPLAEINVHGKNDERRGIGSGLSTIEAGLRLRYELTRRFAPYIGVVRERAFGRTADFRLAEDEAADDTRIVAGVRIWF